MHVHVRGHLPFEYYLNPWAYARRLKSDLHAMHELNEKNHTENERLKAEMLASEYQNQVLSELINVLAKPARKEDNANA